ncbi:MAG: metallophosphoesterase [Spirosomataceae bacterium]
MAIFRNLFLVCVLLSSFYPSMAQKILRGPYLHSGTATSIIVRWRTEVATSSKVLFGTTSTQKDKEAVDATVTTEHQVKIAGLIPNTVYFYGINAGINGEIITGNDYYFKTAPPKESTQKVRIWAMGDMGDGSPNQKSVRDAYLQSIKNDNRQTDVLLLLGDNAYAIGTDEEYQNNFFNIYQDHFLKNNVLWSVPGNHEYYSGAQNKREVAYFQLFSFPQNGEGGGVPSGTEMYYSFDYANVHFVALDSYGIEQDRYRLSDTLGPQVEWLKKDLAANRLPWTIVMFHHPPYTKNSHDSDAEQELSLIRENLTPILERYKVDLVLSGHSHLYERSRPMRGHTGKSDSFRDNVHLSSLSSGRYDGFSNSCAYIKNGQNEGVIYVVAGSSGQNNGYNGVAHPAMPYKNATNGGSVVIEVEDNRLDFEWLCNDRIVRDQFTIFKNVNKSTNLKAKHGDLVRLNPSWKGSYLWSNGSRQASLSFTLTNDTTFIVRDSLGCLQDVFKVQLTEKPVIKTGKTTEMVCAGDKLTIPFTVTNTEASKWRYSLQLSDKQGDFTDAIVLANATNSPFNLTIANNILTGNAYRFRVVADVQGIEFVASEPFVIHEKPKAILSGGNPIEAGKTTQLTLTFSGSPPWTYRLSDNSIATTFLNPLMVPVSPLKNTTYELTSIRNSCGEGIISGSAQVIVIPKIVTNLSVSQVLCNETTFDLPFSMIGEFDTKVNFEAQLSDNQGSFGNPKTIGSAVQSPIKAMIPNDIVFGGNYQIRVLPTQNVSAVATPSMGFNIKQRARAMISGDTIIQFGEQASLKLKFEGQSPYTYTLSDNSTQTVATASYQILVKPELLTTYSLLSVSNVCGNGTISGSARVNVIITGIEEEKAINVFPNPTHDKLNIEIKGTRTQTLEWDMIDATGRKVKKGVLRKNQPNYFEVELADLPAGVYVLRMGLVDKTITRKIVKH